MEGLLISRMNKDVSPAKLSNLSPDKYGKAAWADLTYTPSKLADNVMYREAATLKKNEEGSSKLRELEAMNGFMKQRLGQLEIERDGIEQSLHQQITMYKKMLHQSQTKNEARLKEIQKRFSNQISMLIQQKQEEAKFSQAEKEILEGRIAELEEKVRQGQQRLAVAAFDQGALRGDYQRLNIEHENLKQSFAKLEKDRANQADQWKRSKEIMNKQWGQLQKKYQQQLQGLLKEKTKEKEAMERLMRTELQKLQNVRAGESLRKTQQLREVMSAFENETKRLNEIVAMKDRMLESLTYQNAKNKQNIVQITANYESRVGSLTNNRNDLTQQVQKYIGRIGDLERQMEAMIADWSEQRESLGETIVKLKDNLQHNQYDFIRERDKYQYWGADLEKQNIFLKSQNGRMEQILAENEGLSLELRKLRDLLVQSSFEIEKSKEELMRMSFERDALAMKMEKVMTDNERMFRVGREMEEGSQKWRNSFCSQRRMVFR